MNNLQLTPIGEVCVDSHGMSLHLHPAYLPALQGLEGFGHLSVLWWFSGCDTPAHRGVLTAPKPYRTAPEALGTFATRSPLRPNPIGLTTVEVLEVDADSGVIRVAYIDADHGTPLLDIKPYTPSLDRVERPAVPNWCAHWPKSLEESGEFAWEEEFNF